MIWSVKKCMRFGFEMRSLHNTTYLIKDPLFFIMLSRTFVVSFPCSCLFPSIIFLLQIDVSFQTDDTKLKYKQPQVLIVYVGGSIQCWSIWFGFASISFNLGSGNIEGATGQRLGAALLLAHPALDTSHLCPCDIRCTLVK